MSRGRKDEVSASTRPTGFFGGNNNNSNNANSNNSIGNTNFNIRGLSSGINSGMSIRGESGPSIVVISNLDPGANAEDVKVKDLTKAKENLCGNRKQLLYGYRKMKKKSR